MHKKILGLLLIFSLISPSLALNPNYIATPYSGSDYYKENRTNSQQELLQKTRQENILKQKQKKIDLIVEKFLEKIKTSEKAEKILAKLDKIDSSKYNKEIRYFLGTLRFKLNRKLEDLKYKEIDEKYKKFREEQIKKAKEAQEKYIKEQKEKQKKVEEKINSKISKTDKISGERKILELQKILAGDINNSISNLEKKFEKYLYVQEKGNLKADLNIDINEIKLKTNLNLKDYFSNTQFLDNELKTNLELLIDSKAKNDLEKNFNLEISSFLHVIQKNGDIFLLLKDLKIDGKDLPQDLKISLNRIKNSPFYDALAGKFIKIPNNNIGIENSIKNFKIDDIKKEISKKLEKPLLTPYKKVGNKYYLIPTQYACDLFLEFSKIIPYFYYGNETSCTKEMYQGLLMEIEDNNIEIFLENNKLGLKVNFDKNENQMEKVEGFIDFSGNELKQINFEMIPSQKRFPKEKLLFNYKKRENINFYLNVNSGDIYNKTNISLDKLNRIQTTKITGNLKDFTNNLNYNFEYKNNKFSGKIDVKNDKQDIFNLDFSGEILKDYFKLNSNFETENIYEKQLKQARDMSRYYQLKSIQSAIEMYYADNGGYPMTKKDFDELKNKGYLSKIQKDPLGNVEINGCKFGIFYEVGEDLAGIGNGAFRLSSCMETQEKIEIGNLRKTAKITKSFYISGYDSWEKKEAEKDEKIKGKLNIETDLRNNKDNANIFFNINEGEKEIFNFKLENKGKVEFKKQEIKAPKDYIDLNKAMQNSY